MLQLRTGAVGPNRVNHSRVNYSTEEAEYQVLQHIAENESVAQRALAAHAGVSLGMTNAIIRRLATKGFLKIRKLNERKLRYAVTPEGFDALARRSVRYVRRTIKNVVEYREAVSDVLSEAKAAGRTTVVLLGQSDIAFIIEYYCLKLGLTYRVEPADGDLADIDLETTLIVQGENCTDAPAASEEVVSVTSILAGA